MEYREGKARLDRSRPFGEVYGPGQIRYEQDNKPFDARGRELVPADAKPAKQKTPQPVAEADDTGASEADDSDAGIDGEVPVEDRPLGEVTMAQLRTRYIEVTGGDKAKVGLTKAALAEKIRGIVQEQGA